MAYELTEFHRNVSDEELVADLRRVAAGNKSVTTREYNAKGKFHSNTVIARFGGWTAACARAELQIAISRNIPDEELFRNLEGMWIHLGRQPRHREMVKPHSRYSKATYAERFGSWLKALTAFVEYINAEGTPQSEDAIRDWQIEPATKHKTPRNINDRLRVRVFVRDNHTCQICGRVPGRDGVVLHVDHIKAYVKGGETVMENLQTLCSKCNLGKGDFDPYVKSDREVIDVNI